MPDESTEYEVLIKTKLDAAGAKAAAETLRKLGAEAKQGGKDLTSTGAGMDRLSGASKNWMALITSTATALAFKSAKDYAAGIQGATSTSQQWLTATYKLQDAYSRLGQIFSQTLLPYMTALANLADKAAKFLKVGPSVAGVTGAATGTTGVTGGQNLSLGGLATTGVVDITAASLLTKFLPGIAKIFGGPVIQGLIAGGSLYNWAAQGQAGRPTSGQFVGEAGSLAGLGGGMIAGTAQGLLSGKGMQASMQQGKATAEAWFKSIAGLTGQMQTASAATDEWKGTTQQLRAALSYMRQEQQAQRQEDIQVFRANRDFQRQEQYATQDYDRQRLRENRDFQMQMAFTEEEFYRQRAIAVRDYNISMARSDEDYQRSRKREAEDHQFDLFQIALTGDAMSYWLSQRQYNIQRGREEEDYGIQRSRAAQDFQLQLADSQNQFNIQRAYTQKQFDITMADQAQDFKIQRDRAAADFKIQMDDMQANFDEERRLRKIAFQDQLTDMTTDAATYRNMLINELYTPAGQDLNTFVTDARGMFDQLNKDIAAATPNGASHQFGGYTHEGDRTHAGEFVLTSETTHAIERAARSNSLTQSSVMRMLMGGGGSVTYNDHRRIDSKISSEDRAALNQDTRELLASLIGA